MTRTKQRNPRRRPSFRWLGLLAACGLLAVACSSSGDNNTEEADAGSSAAPAEAPEPTETDDQPAGDDEEASDADVEDTEAAPEEPAGDAESAGEEADAPDDAGDTSDADDTAVSSEVRGITDDTITIGYLYLDLDDVRERGLISLNWGPQGEHVQVIVDHINANGGINGRSIEIIPRAFSPIGGADARSACLELTEDAETFAVLGALRNDEALCYTEQHDTIAIANGDLTRERLDRSTAPYASVNASRERIIGSFVAEGVERGLFDDRTIAVLSTDAADVAADVAIPALTDAGVAVEQEHLIRSDGTLGGAAVAVSNATETLRAGGVDAVFVVGDAIVAVNTFIGAGFFPTLYFTDQGSATVTSGRADLTGFEAIYTYGPPSASERYGEPVFQQECVEPWNGLNPDAATMDPALVPDGEPNHAVGLSAACRALAVFTTIAEATGADLNNATFQAALDALGEFHLPGTGPATLGAGKYDAEDNLRLAVFNPDAAEDEPNFVAVGE